MVDAAAIAAEVALRYGVAVCPSVVQVCPPRTFSEATPVWNPQTRTLVYADHGARAQAYKKVIWAGAVRAKAAAVDATISDRRGVVQRLHGEGLHNPAIAARLGVSTPTIAKDVAMLGLRANGAPAVPRCATQIKTATLIKMRDAGDGLEAICAFLGLKPDTVRRMARQAGRPFSTRTAWQGQAQAMQARVMQMKAAGVACDAIAVDLRIQPNSVRRIARLAGQPFDTKAYAQTGTADRTNEVLRRQAEGQTGREIALAMGLVVTSVYRIATRAGWPFMRVAAAAQPREVKAKAPRKSRAKAKAPRVAKVKIPRNLGLTLKQTAKADRRAKVADLHGRGFGFLAICAVLDAGKSTIHRDLTELGLITNSRWKKPLFVLLKGGRHD